MFGSVFFVLFIAVIAANAAFGGHLTFHFFVSVKDETPIGNWFWFWAVGLVLALGGFIGFMQGGIWAVLLGTILYVIAALRSRHKQVMPPLS